MPGLGIGKLYADESLEARIGRTQNILKKKAEVDIVEDLCKEESDFNYNRQVFLQIFEILYEQGLLREDEKNRMRVMLTRMSDGVGGYRGTGSHL